MPDQNEIAKTIASNASGQIPYVGWVLGTVTSLFWPETSPDIWSIVKTRVEDTARRIAKEELAKDELDNLRDYLIVIRAKLDEIDKRDGTERLIRLITLSEEIYTNLQQSFLQELENGMKLFMFHPLFPVLSSLHLSIIAEIRICSETKKNTIANENMQESRSKQYARFIDDSFETAMKYRLSLVDFHNEAYWLMKEDFYDGYLQQTFEYRGRKYNDAKKEHTTKVTEETKKAWAFDYAKILLEPIQKPPHKRKSRKRRIYLQ